MYLYFYSWSAKEEEELKWTLSAACVFTCWWQVIGSLLPSLVRSPWSTFWSALPEFAVLQVFGIWSQHSICFFYFWVASHCWLGFRPCSHHDRQSEIGRLWSLNFRFCHLLSFGFVFVYVYVSCLVRTGVLAAHVRAVESRKAEPALCR